MTCFIGSYTPKKYQGLKSDTGFGPPEPFLNQSLDMLFFCFDRASGNGSLLVLIVNSAQEYMVMLQFKSWTYQSNFYCKRFLPAVFCDLFYWKSYPPNKYQGLTSSAPSKLFIPFLFEFCNIFNPIRYRLWELRFGSGGGGCWKTTTPPPWISKTRRRRNILKTST